MHKNNHSPIYKDTSTCCFVKFISPLPSLLKPIANCPLCDGGTGHFARGGGGRSEGQLFCQDSFNPLLGILLLVSLLLHPGLVWVIVPRRERLGSCQLQLRVWMNNKEIYKTRVETKVLAHSRLLSLLAALID